MNHRLEVAFDASSENESLARMIASAFMAAQNPTLEEIEDVKTAVSEAVTNAIIHGYQEEEQQVEMLLDREGTRLVVQIIDKGVGIENIEEALQPFFTTKPELERSGMGFAFMDAFMDELSVFSEPGKGTRIVMTKYIERENEQ